MPSDALLLSRPAEKYPRQKSSKKTVEPFVNGVTGAIKYPSRDDAYTIDRLSKDAENASG